MSLFSFFRSEPRKTAATQARDRLQILLAHERTHRSAPDFLPQLQNELIQVISKYVNIDADKVAVRVDRLADVSTLEVNIELPSINNTSSNSSFVRAKAG